MFYGRRNAFVATSKPKSDVSKSGRNSIWLKTTIQFIKYTIQTFYLSRSYMSSSLRWNSPCGKSVKAKARSCQPMVVPSQFPKKEKLAPKFLLNSYMQRVLFFFKYPISNRYPYSVYPYQFYIILYFKMNCDREREDIC